MTTQAEIAQKLDVSVSTVSKWLNGKCSPFSKEWPKIQNNFPWLFKLLRQPIKVGDTLQSFTVTFKYQTDVVCECNICGISKVMNVLDFDKVVSCENCYGIKNYTPKGTIRTKLKQVWSHMIRRCSEKASDIERKAYYDRGVRVCDEWRGPQGRSNFISWAIDNGYVPGLQLDKDLKGDGLLYSPDTCCFLTRRENNALRKKAYSNSGKHIPYVGVSVNDKGAYFSQVVWGGKRVFGKTFKNLKDAVEARNNYIRSNNLPHTINVLDE